MKSEVKFDVCTLAVSTIVYSMCILIPNCWLFEIDDTLIFVYKEVGGMYVLMKKGTHIKMILINLTLIVDGMWVNPSTRPCACKLS